MVPNQLSATLLAHAGGAHRLHDTAGVAQLTEGPRREDRSTVGVEHHTCDVPAACRHGHVERVRDELGAHVVRCGPADHPTAEHIEDRGQVAPAFDVVEVGDVPTPGDGSAPAV